MCSQVPTEVDNKQCQEMTSYTHPINTYMYLICTYVHTDDL